AAESLEALAALDLRATLAPSPRAHLYAVARARLTGRRPSLDQTWWSSGAPEPYRSQLAALRGALLCAPSEQPTAGVELPANTFELAELTFTRRLDTQEVAHVLGLAPPAVEAALSTVERVARQIL